MIARASGWLVIGAGVVAFWFALVWGVRELMGMS